MNLDLGGRAFLVLGATRGLGRAVAEELLSEGARVLVAGRDPDRARRAASEMGAGAGSVCLDVALPEAPLLAREAVERELGRLDGILISSGGPPAGAALSVGDEQWLLAYQLLLGGPLRLLRELVPTFHHPASVLWVTSSSVRQPIPGLDTSNALRPGIAALVKALARDLAPQVRVNSIAPGRFDTDRVRELDLGRARAAGIPVDEQREKAQSAIPMGRYGDPRELGRVAAFLLSPAASYVSGISMQVDGGLVTAVP